MIVRRNENITDSEMMEHIITISLHRNKMTSTTTEQQQHHLNRSVCGEAPLTQALNHIEREIQQQGEESEPTGKALASHVPVSVGSETNSSSSTLCSISSKEGSEIEDMMSASASTYSESNKTNEFDTIRTRIESQDSTPAETIRASSNSSVESEIDVSSSSTSAALGKSSAPLPSLITTRPVKKARTVSNEYSNSTCIDADGSSSAAPPSFISTPSHQQRPSLLLLAQEGDDENLNPLHVFIRKQIEVFTATATELAQPAPGRKQPIQLHQIGLRCIHCRNVHSNGGKKTRVKRAVCYPSSVGRIYHSVSDMKFDHFPNCKAIPPEVRKTFETLKAGAKRTQKDKQSKSGGGSNKKGYSSSSTAKYYRYCASRMGLIDSPGGIIYMNTALASATQHLTRNQNMVSATITKPNVPPQLLQAPFTAGNFSKQDREEPEHSKLLLQRQCLTAANNAAVMSMLYPPMQISRILAANRSKENIDLNLNHLVTGMNSAVMQSLLINAISVNGIAQKSIDAAIALAIGEQQSERHDPQQNPLKRPHESSPSTHTTASAPGNSAKSSIRSENTTYPLAAPDDAEVLNPIHCFVREHVELFSADKDDIAAPCPGRKTRVTLGQVGIRCKHCARLDLHPKDRVKRAVCYPPSIDGIYHSVSNMKFDHFGICPSLPPSAREELASLRTLPSGRRSANSSNSSSKSSISSNHGGTNTTKYYRDSAVAKGLVDTDKGIRFSNPHISASTATRTSPQQSGTKRSAAASAKDMPKIPAGLSALVMAAASHATVI